MERKSIRVLSPATTANLGPGFDCMGMALDIWNQVTVVPAGETKVEIQGEGANDLPRDERNLVYQAMERLFDEAGVELPAISLHCRNQIPPKRGLGSSASAIVGGLVAANHLLMQVAEGERKPFSDSDLLEIASDIEGHPDNVAACLLGGLQLVVREDHSLVTAPVPLPEDLKAVLLIPDSTVSTKEARSVLPDKVAMQDAVYNIGRVALLVNALATGRLEDLGMATKDKLHQPYRQRLIKGMKVIFESTLKADALGVFLSGSGPTILALTRNHEMTVAYYMADAARQCQVNAEVKITSPSPNGAHLAVKAN